MEETNDKLRGHLFLPANAWSKWPKLYSTEEVPAAEKLIYAHYFLGGSEWFLAEVSVEEFIGFGWCVLNGDLLNAEWGYVSLVELEGITLPIEGTEAKVRLVERDIDWLVRTAREALPEEAWAWSLKDDE